MGSVTHYDPYQSFSLDWHINYSTEHASKVEVRFIPLEENRTRVQLTHSRWEVFGDKAADMRGGYEAGWVGVFEQAYKQACEGAVTV